MVIISLNKETKSNLKIQIYFACSKQKGTFNIFVIIVMCLTIAHTMLLTLCELYL